MALTLWGPCCPSSNSPKDRCRTSRGSPSEVVQASQSLLSLLTRLIHSFPQTPEYRLLLSSLFPGYKQRRHCKGIFLTHSDSSPRGKYGAVSPLLLGAVRNSLSNSDCVGICCLPIAKNKSYISYFSYWRITALPCCVSFCCTMKRICSVHTQSPSLPRIPPSPALRVTAELS